MKANIGNIFVSESNFDYIRKVYNSNKAKNFSQTIDYILKYNIELIDQHQRTIERIQELLRENKELQQTIDDYRTQVIKA